MKHPPLTGLLSSPSVSGWGIGISCDINLKNNISKGEKKQQKNQQKAQKISPFFFLISLQSKHGHCVNKWRSKKVSKQIFYSCPSRRMIVATGAGFVSFSLCLYPFNPQKPLQLFWRWVTPPCFFPGSPSLSTSDHERVNCSRDVPRWGLQGESERHR